MIPIITTNARDGGLDLVRGPDVTGQEVGHIYWDTTGPDAGLVMRIDGRDFLPGDVEQVVTILDEFGYDLTDESRADVAGLVPDVKS